jgi:hypothetical protein
MVMVGIFILSLPRSVIPELGRMAGFALACSGPMAFQPEKWSAPVPGGWPWTPAGSCK